VQVAVILACVALSVGAYAQASSPVTDANPDTAQSDRQSNAASATKDNSGISGDQVTKPEGAKSSTLIGCLNGPDSDGHLHLRSMQHRSGVEVAGPNDLASASGKKVKLSGRWEPVEPRAQTESDKAAAGNAQLHGAKPEAQRFQATTFDVMADTCSVPVEVTPISKKKQQQEKAAAAQNSSNNPK